MRMVSYLAVTLRSPILSSHLPIRTLPSSTDTIHHLVQAVLRAYYLPFHDFALIHHTIAFGIYPCSAEKRVSEGAGALDPSTGYRAWNHLSIVPRVRHRLVSTSREDLSVGRQFLPWSSLRRGFHIFFGHSPFRLLYIASGFSLAYVKRQILLLCAQDETAGCPCVGRLPERLQNHALLLGSASPSRAVAFRQDRATAFRKSARCTPYAPAPGCSGIKTAPATRRRSEGADATSFPRMEAGSN